METAKCIKCSVRDSALGPAEYNGDWGSMQQAVALTNYQVFDPTDDRLTVWIGLS